MRAADALRGCGEGGVKTGGGRDMERGLGSSKLPVEYTRIISRHGRQAVEGSEEVHAGQDRGMQIQDRRVAGMCGVEAAFTITSGSVNDHDATKTQARKVRLLYHHMHILSLCLGICT